MILRAACFILTATLESRNYLFLPLFMEKNRELRDLKLPGITLLVGGSSTMSAWHTLPSYLFHPETAPGKEEIVRS